MDNTGIIPSSIAVWLPVPDCVKAIDFYTSAFAATEAYRLELPDGNLAVARLSVDGASFWLSQEPGGDLNAAATDGRVRMIFTVTDPHTVFNRALQAGASVIFPVGEEHGWRLGRLVDPFGYHWEIGRPLTA